MVVRNVLILLSLYMAAFSASAGPENIQKECILRASWFTGFYSLYNNTAIGCTKKQVKLFIHESANGGVTTMNNCINQTGDKIPSGVDGKKFEEWGNAMVENLWNNTIRSPFNRSGGMFDSFATACMSDPEKFIGDLWLYR
jgi:hypothetical protein